MEPGFDDLDEVQVGGSSRRITASTASREALCLSALKIFDDSVVSAAWINAHASPCSPACPPLTQSSLSCDVSSLPSLDDRHGVHALRERRSAWRSSSPARTTTEVVPETTSVLRLRCHENLGGGVVDVNALEDGGAARDGDDARGLLLQDLVHALRSQRGFHEVRDG